MKASLANTLYSLVAIVLLASCQQQSYTINGKADGLADGDTLFLTTDMEMGVPIDTLIVSDGKFTLSGQSDSVQLAMIYHAERNEQNVNFFLEPGTINVQLSDQPGMSRAGGTRCNDEWQRLNDSVMVIGREINRIAEHIYGSTVSPEEQQKGMEEIERQNQRFSKIVIETTERNIDNEFGYFLLTYYPEELIDNKTRARLIKQLPEAMQQRPAIKQIEEMIAHADKTAEGETISDFTQTTPDGSNLSILSVIGQNKITVIDFWASWCGPCRQEMPFMVQLYDALKDKGFGMVGISLDDDRDAWREAIKKLGITWPQMSDLKGWENEAALQFNVPPIPHTIVVDKQGRILRRGLRGESLKEFVESQL